MESIGIYHLLILAVIAAMLAAYIAPSLLAFRRNHPRRVAISLVNVFLGWSVVGWIAALIWASKRA